MYSGDVAALVFMVLAQDPSPRTLVLLGAMHRPRGTAGVVCGSARWRTPLGDLEVDHGLVGELERAGLPMRTDLAAHQEEHSLEVLAPFIRELLPGWRILPILVPPTPEAAAWGRTLGESLRSCDAPLAIVASTDLTHYGPRYGFVPHGIGPAGFRWAKEENDRRMIDLMLQLNADPVVAEAGDHRNACGAGAVAATLAALPSLGASDAMLLRHTTSAETVPGSSATDAVGYAAIIFHSRKRAG
jgi:hypothetical protein